MVLRDCDNLVGFNLAASNTLIYSLVDIITALDLTLTFTNAHKKISRKLLAVANATLNCPTFIASYLRVSLSPHERRQELQEAPGTGYESFDGNAEISLRHT